MMNPLNLSPLPEEYFLKTSFSGSPAVKRMEDLALYGLMRAIGGEKKNFSSRPYATSLGGAAGALPHTRMLPDK